MAGLGSCSRRKAVPGLGFIYQAFLTTHESAQSVCAVLNVQYVLCVPSMYVSGVLFQGSLTCHRPLRALL